MDSKPGTESVRMARIPVIIAEVIGSLGLHCTQGALLAGLTPELSRPAERRQTRKTQP